jgi:hypothetical protein
MREFFAHGSRTREEVEADVISFFTNQQSYTSKQENKLRFWQSLCIVVSPSRTKI